MTLLTFMARACHYAQEHILDWHDEADLSTPSRETLLQCTSYQMACFLCQNTVHGDWGVGWDIIIEELDNNRLLTEAEWKKILRRLVKELGGWKKGVR